MNDCLFCGIARGQIPAVLLYENEETVAFMDISPAADGHALIVPRAHFTNILDIPEDLVRTCMAAAQRVAIAIDAALSPDGLRINQFNGRAAGQTVFHYHLHVVPILAGQQTPSHGRSQSTPEQLESVAERIRRHL